MAFVTLSLLRRSSKNSINNLFLSSKRFAGSLVLVQHNNEKYSSSTLNTVTAASNLGEVSCLVAGHKCDKVAEEVSKIGKVSNVIHVDHEVLANNIAETLTNVILKVQEKEKFTSIVADADAFGKNIIPRLSIKLNSAPISDVIKINSQDTFMRFIYAGNALQTIKSSDEIKLITFRNTSFEPSSLDGKGQVKKAEVDAGSLQFKNTEFVKKELVKSDKIDLGSAKVVIGGGRGLKTKEGFQMLYDLAGKFSNFGAVGATRAAVDSGFCTNDIQIGQTGKIVAPALYIAVGISGAIQHVAGMKDSKVIVAINKDPEAPIFQIADHGLVDDLFKVLPELIEKIKK